MSVATDSQVCIALSDYAGQDASGKANIIGAGWSITGLQPTGLTPELTVVVFIEIPAMYRGQEFASSIMLVDEAGDPVSFPGPDGQPQPLRVQQLLTVDPPMAPGVRIPENVPTHRQILMRLANGLPLRPNQLYKWIYEIDGNPKASASFYIAGPPPAPVIG